MPHEIYRTEKLNHQVRELTGQAEYQTTYIKERINGLEGRSEESSTNET